MNCDPQALISASREFCCIPNGMQRAVIISLLCEWAINPACRVSWTPETSVASWIDASGVHGGDLNTFIATADVETITSFDISGTGIDSFSGLECMPLLNTLRINNNQLTGILDLSVCPLLSSVQCGFNQLSGVIITGLNNLTLLDASNNIIPTTVVNTILIDLDASGVLNGEVDLNAQTPLAPPSQVGRNSAANLVADGWTVVLDEISWSPAINVSDWVDSGGPNSGNLAFFLANADFDTVTSLTTDTTANTTTLSGLQGLIGLGTLVISEDGLITLDCRNCFALQIIACSSVPTLSTLLLNGNPSLTNLSCYQCSITSLNLAGLNALTTLDCSFNALTLLNCSGLTSLTTLTCSNNGLLTTLTLIGCTKLVTLACNNCALTGLNVSGFNLLSVLDCYSNDILILTISGCTALSALDCSDNLLTTLDISPCVLLAFLNCVTNSLTNANPTYVINKILVDLVATTIQGGTVDCSGQTPAAPPSSPGGGFPDGIAAVATLTGYASPWTVTTD